jgi:hypothetical protein
MATGSRRASRFACLILIGAACARPAAAQPADCGGLRALLDADNGRLASVGLRVEPGGGIAINVRGNAIGLPPAKECTFAGGAAATELNCQWRYAARAEAEAAHDRLLARMRVCLGAESMRPATIYPATTAWRVVQRSQHQIEREPGATSIALELVEYAAEGAPATLQYFVALSVDRSEH